MHWSMGNNVVNMLSEVAQAIYDWLGHLVINDTPKLMYVYPLIKFVFIIKMDSTK